MARKIRRKRRYGKKKPLRDWILLALVVTAFVLGLSRLLLSSLDGSNQVTEAQIESSPDVAEFVTSIGETARQVAHDNDLYASVMIAQAVLESASGQSALSQAPYYNFFGIKGDYLGNSVTLETWEDDGLGNAYTIDAQFRSYGNQAESLQDYANLLQKDIYTSVRKSNTRTYQDATAALTGTYATDTSYGQKLNILIETYGLTIYDSL